MYQAYNIYIHICNLFTMHISRQVINTLTMQNKSVKTSSHVICYYSCHPFLTTLCLCFVIELNSKPIQDFLCFHLSEKRI